MRRGEIIASVIDDLKSLPDQTHYRYAIDENIIFFKAASTFLSYLRWAITRAPNIDGKKLLEINDFPFPKWDRRMHTKLIQVERRNFPGLIRPLVERLLAFIIAQNRPLKILSLGSGGMEVERQIITRLVAARHAQPVIFVGVDKSDIAHQLAKQNINELESNSSVGVRFADHTDDAVVGRLLEGGKRFEIVLSNTNIFSLTNCFSRAFFDVAFHSLFKHHLTRDDRVKVDEVIHGVATKCFEYDGYKSMALLIPQSISGWQDPVFLNAVVFSNLRYLTRKELESAYGHEKIHFFPIGFYLLESQY